MNDETLALTQSLRADTFEGETVSIDPSSTLGHTLPLRADTTTTAAGDVDTDTDTLPAAAGRESPAPPAARVGRYRVLRKLGEGGMGVVFSAYDDELARPIALKFLHTGGRMSPAKAREARERMQREAQAMAQLSHPNVVQIYDVGEHEDELFIAMELIHGRTLDEWLEELGPPRERMSQRPALVEAFVQAGRGLAAAHAAGLVHRDFKPANVLVGDDGVVRVLDFGLARGTVDAPLTRSGGLTLDSHSSGLSSPMTRTGTLLGTPAYFSPEQMRALPLDAASDQFSFCVALHEALYGVRPHAGRTFAELRESLRHDRRADLPAEVHVPAWLRAVIDRGLALDPAARWPSMDALLDALLDDPARRQRRRIGLAAALACGLALGGGVWLEHNQAEARCEALAGELGTTWNDARRDELDASFARSGAGEGGLSWTRLEPALDEWAGRWRDARHEACTLERAGAGHSRARADCLERARWQFEGLVEVLAHADRSAVFEAREAVASLPPPARCEDPGWLASEPPPSPWWSASAEAAKQVRRDLAKVFALERVADYPASARLAEHALARARALDDEVLEAEALAKQGAMRWRNGDDQRAQVELSDAHFLAGALGYERVAAAAALELVGVVGVRLELPEQGRMWLRLARMHLRGMGLDPDEDRRLWFWLGELEYSAGHYEDALAAHERAYAIAERTLAPGHPDLASSLTSLGQVHRQLGAPEAALSVLERALELKREALGPHHPSVAYIHDSLATVLTELGRPDEALAAHERAIATAERSLGAEHRDLATLRNNYATALYTSERYGEAAEQFEAVLALREAQRGPEHREVALVLNNLAAVEAELGHLERAVELMARVLAIEEASLGPTHGDLAITVYNLGVWLERLGRLDEALAHKLRCLDIYAELHGTEHLEYARVLRGVGHVRASLGDHAQALVDYRRTLEIRRALLRPGHPKIAGSLNDLGTQLRALGQLDAALVRHREALALREAEHGPDDPSLARSLLGVAETLALQGEHEQVLAQVERALALLEGAGRSERLARALELREASTQALAGL